LNWEAVGAIAELLGAMGVIASLIYLAFQIRQNTQSSKAATFQSVTSDALQYALTISDNEELTRILRLGSETQDRLPEDDYRRFQQLVRVYLRFHDNIFYQYRIGTLDEGQWSGYRHSLRLVLSSPGIRSWWRAGGNRHMLSPTFQELVDSELVSLDAGLAGGGAQGATADTAPHEPTDVW
jgi:hypothetical protein